MPILNTFRDEARRRGLLAADASVTIDAAYRLVRDMAFARASDNRPETVVAEWRGLSDTKHHLLAQILEELGYEVATIVATHEFAEASEPWLPPHLLEEVKRQPVRNVMTFLRVRTDPVGDDWTTIDATWPYGTKALGVPANEDFRAGVDQRTSGVPEEIVHVLDDENAMAVAAGVLADFAGVEIPRTMQFLDALAAFLAFALTPIEGETDGW